jgi:hypothetical protein
LKHNQAVPETEELDLIAETDPETEFASTSHQKTFAFSTSALERHARKCKICSHKDREDIEADFLHWHRCSEISWDYQIKDVRAVYRHAHATGLYERRNKNVRFAVAHIVERSDTSRTSTTAILNAIRALSLIDENGVWHEPVRHSVRPPASPRSRAASRSPENDAAPSAKTSDSTSTTTAPTGFFNRYLPRLKNAATPSKQSPEASSNRHSQARLHTAQNPATPAPSEVQGLSTHHHAAEGQRTPPASSDSLGHVPLRWSPE